VRWLARAVEERWLCGSAHDPEIAYVRIGADSKVKFVALSE
jgi:hypothetical protein